MPKSTENGTENVYKCQKEGYVLKGSNINTEGSKVRR